MSRTLGDYLLGEVVEEDTHTITYRAQRKPRDDDDRRKERAGDQGRPLLIKALKPGLRPNRRLRSGMEAQWSMLLRLAHPHLPTALGRFRSKETMALLFVDHGGYRLSKVMRQAVVLPHGPATAVALAVGEALAAIHRVGLVHGHLRLGAVEVTEGGQVFLHGLNATAPRDAPLDNADELSPEQLLGQAPGPRTDVFLLGSLLYRMLAGRGPFDGDDDAAAGQRVRQQAPLPLPERAPPIPASLGDIVMRCLTKRPATRFNDMNSLVSALDHNLRSWSSVPRDVLVSRALAQAGLAEALSPPAALAGATSGSDGALQRWRRPLLLAASGLLLATVAVALWRFGRDDTDSRRQDNARGIVDRPAYVRVLAQPWAEVHLDGRQVDVTPVGRPLKVPPGRHTFVFKHPNASDESRSVELVAGQTILLDVQMQIVRPAVSAPPAASSEEASP